MTGWEDEPTVAEMKAAGKHQRGLYTESGEASKLEVTGLQTTWHDRENTDEMSSVPIRCRTTLHSQAYV